VSTAGYVKLLLPPRQSRGNSHWGLVDISSLVRTKVVGWEFQADQLRSPQVGTADLWTRNALRLQQRSRIFSVAVGYGIGAHIRECLDGQSGIKSTHGRESRAADHEQIWNIPGLSIAIDN
jgi:hypothetical protein